MEKLDRLVERVGDSLAEDPIRMGMYAFQTLAYEAGAVYHIPRLPPLVNCEKFEEYLEKYNM